MKRIIFIWLMSVVFLFASAENSLACSCLFSDKPVKTQVKKAYKDSNAIFSGEVTEITESSTDEYYLIVKFKVEESWKGKAEKEITITTAADSAMCGYGFKVGEKYVVYAHGSDDELSTNICSRTTFVTDNPDVKYLAKLKRKNRN